MKKIIFKINEYNLVSDINVSASRLQATLEKGEFSINELVEECTNAETITIKEDEEIIGIYNGYTFMLGITIRNDNISVELINEDIQTQIDALYSDVDTVKAVQTSQGTAIENLNERLDEAVDTYADKAEAADILLGDTEV